MCSATRADRQVREVLDEPDHTLAEFQPEQRPGRPAQPGRPVAEVGGEHEPGSQA